MNSWEEVGKFLLYAGLIIIGLGLFFMAFDKLPFGRLPGDIRLMQGKLNIHIPIVTCLLVSAVITIIINVLHKR